MDEYVQRTGLPVAVFVDVIIIFIVVILRKNGQLPTTLMFVFMAFIVFIAIVLIVVLGVVVIIIIIFGVVTFVDIITFVYHLHLYRELASGVQ